MRCAIIISAAFAALAAAKPVKRDLPTIEAAFTNVTNALTTLDNGVKAATAAGNIQQQEAQLQNGVLGVLSALNNGATAINATSPIVMLDALQLVTPSNLLISLTTSTINDLVAKHDLVASYGMLAEVVVALKLQRSSTQNFIVALGTKVPAQAQDFVKSQGQKCVDAINKGITSFGGSITKRDE